MTAARLGQDHRTFVLRLESRCGKDGIHGLRALLKTALRKYGLVCIEAREEGNANATRRDREATE